MERFDRGIFFNNFNLADQQIYLRALSPFTKIQTTNPRILIYNWIPFDDPNFWGGGVSIYCTNLIKAFKYYYPSINIYFLSSGFAYDAKKDKPFIRKINNSFFNKNDFWGNVQQYELVNSPVPAPITRLMVNPSSAIANETIKDVFYKFIIGHGPFHAIHFNNIEGISLDVFDLKQQFPNCKFIYSIHNYVPFCPHGFYYMRHKHRICSEKRTGSDCIVCSRIDIKHNIGKEIYEVCGLHGNDPKACIDQKTWVEALNLDSLDHETDAEHILDYCHAAVEKINNNCDVILAVSDRVKTIALQNGMTKDKLKTSYIGTAVAENQTRKAATRAGSDILKIIYLGNQIHIEEKGYPFLVSALAEMPSQHASRIDLVFTMRPPVPSDIHSRLRHFHSLKIIEGYRHEELRSILSGCHLSIVPVLWEDNLPQIAIESVAYGVPVLASSAGGASELCKSPLFKFEAGNGKDLRDKLVRFLNSPQDLQKYWEHHDGLTTMSEHAAEMYKMYNLPKMEGVSFTAEEWYALTAELNFYREHFRG